jgi:uncharacterized protein (TIGR04255 family)
MAVKKTRSTAIYKRNYLAQVVAKVNFSSELPFANNAPSRDIYESIKKTFPLTETNTRKHMQLVVGDENTQETRVSIMEWSYFGKDRTKSITLDKHSVAIQYQSYTSFVDLRKDFNTILNAIYTK